MKLTIEHLVKEGIEIAWYDKRNDSVGDTRTVAAARNARMFILGGVVVEYTSAHTMSFIPLSSIEIGWVK